jgi:lipopolysaccharide exporter
VALLMVLAGPLVGRFYEDERLTSLIWISGATLVVTALGQQIRVIAEKNLEFVVLTRAEIFTSVLALLVAVTIAMGGGGVYALVGGAFTNALVMTALLWVFLAHGWRPMRHFNPREIRHFLGFGAYMIGNNLVNTFNSHVDVLLGGRVLSTQSIGLYSLPRDLCLRIAGVFNPIAMRVGMPVMAKAQNDISTLRGIYLKTIRMTASVNFPFYIALAIFAPEMVHLLFGARWDEAIPLLRILALWGLLRSVVNPVGILVMARGRADLSFKWNLWIFFIYPPLILLGSRLGVIGMASSMLFAGLAVFPANWYWLVRPLCGAGFGEYVLQTIVPLGIAAVSGLVGYLLAEPFSAEMVRLGVGITAGGLTYLLLSARYNDGWFATMRELAVGWK